MSLDFEPVRGEPDPSTLAAGQVRNWLAEVDEAVGRLFVAGLAHPPQDLGPTFELLAHRAATLGAPTAQQGLDRLAHQIESLSPGPPDREQRRVLADAALTEVMGFLTWLRLFRGQVDLQEAGAAAEVEAERDDVPRYTGRMQVLGLYLDGDRLVIVGRDEAGQPLHAVDPLADVDPLDPCGSVVISRLLQRPLALLDLLDGQLEFEGHPFGQARHGRLLKPAFRAVPTLRPHTASYQGPDRLVVRWSDGVRLSDPQVVVRPLLEFNLCKLLCHEPGTAALDVTLQVGRTETRLLRAESALGPLVPAVDARCWAVHPTQLEGWLAEADDWTRAAASLYGGLQPAPAGTDWRFQWLRTQRGERAEPSDAPLGKGIDAFDHVWRRYVLQGSLKRSLLEGRLSTTTLGSDPDPFEVCARALVLHLADPEAARIYLSAHLETVSIDADVLVWMVFAETRMRVLEQPYGLDLPVHPQRMRWAHRLRAWRAGEAAEGLGDILAWGATSGWAETVVTPL